jgi:8-oxo-dGTP pyrophosphatase MutT (NUDIX family)
MAAVAALPASSVIVLRDEPLEVLMLRRSATASFVPNFWVFPGGMVDASDTRDSTLATQRITAARELFEETGIWLGRPPHDAAEKRRALLAGTIAFEELLVEAPIDPEQLVWTSHWITPIGVPKRFDTWFFVTEVGRDVEASLMGNEASALAWIEPETALATLEMIFPTIKNLEALRGFGSARELIASRIGATIEVIQPVIIDRKIVLP